MTLLVACGDDDDEAADSNDSATPLNVVVTDVGGQTKIAIPATVEAGVVSLSFTNSGQGLHSLQFVKVAGDHAVAEILAFLASDVEGGPIPDWISEGGGIGTVNPGQTGTAVFELSQGRHFFWDDENGADDSSNASKGGVGEINVTGDAGDAELPEAVATLTAKEYEFTAKNFKAGSTSVRFENDGNEFHHMIAAPLLPGKTAADAKTFFEAEGDTGGPPPLDFDKGVGTAVVGPGNALVANLNFEAGNYVVVCFINDRTGGPPHFTKGMLTEVKVA